MRKICLNIVLLLTLTFLGQCSNAIGLVVIPSGDVVINPTSILRSFLVTFDVSGPTNMVIKPLDAYITNTSNTDYKIPITDMYLKIGTNSYQAMQNQAITTNYNVGFGDWSQMVNATINASNLPAGTYSTRLLITSTILSTAVTASTYFDLVFAIPEARDITSITGNPSITLTQNDVFDTSGNYILNGNNTKIDISANAKWKLLLDTTSMGTLQGKYFATIVSKTGAITNNISDTFEVNPNNVYQLANGTATSIPVSGSIPTNLFIQYKFQNQSGVYAKEGQFLNPIKYSISSY